MKMTPYQYKWLNLLLLLLCILSKTQDRVARPVVGTDNYWQLAASYNFYKGNGISIARSDTADLAKVVHTRLVGWPPGYPIFVSPFFALFNHDPLKTEMLVFFLAITIHFVSWFLIFKRMGGIYWERVLPLYLLIALFLVNPFKAMGAPTDALSMAFLSLAVLFFFRIYDAERNNEKANLVWVTSLSVAVYLCSFFRYAYYPITFAFVVLFLLLALMQDRRYLRMAIIHGLQVFVFLAIQLLYDTSGPNGMQTVKKMSSAGIFLHVEYLKYYDAIGFNAIFNDNVVYKALGYLPPIKEFVPIAFLVMFPIGLILFTLLILGIAEYYRRIQDTNRLSAFLNDNAGVLFTLASVTSAINIVFITLLSLRSNSAKVDYVWTWLMLTRYFVLVLFFLQLVTVLIVVTNWNKRNHSLRLKATTYGLSFLLLLGCLLGGWQIARLNIKMSPIDYQSNLSELYNPPGAIKDMLSLQRKIEADKSLAAFATVPLVENNYLTPIVAQTAIPLCERENLFNHPRTSKPVNVLVAVRDGVEDEPARKFCEAHQGTIYKRMQNAGITIYLIVILP